MSGRRARRTVGALVAVLAAWAAVLAFPATPALASTGHSFLTELPLVLADPLANPQAVAVDGSGNVFVADNTMGVVDVFDPSGAFKTQFGSGDLESEIDVAGVTAIAVASSGNVYLADRTTSSVDVFKPNGLGGYELLSEWTGANAPGKGFVAPGGVAVDNSTSGADPSKGDVYVVDRGTGAIDVFKPHEGAEEAAEGTFVSSLKAKPKLEVPEKTTETVILSEEGIAVDSATGKVYLANTGKNVVEAFSSSGTFESAINGSGTPTKSLSADTVAVEEATGDLYVDVGGSLVYQFNSAGEWIGGFSSPSSSLLAGAGVAVDNSTSGSDPAKGNVYLGADVFGPNALVPTVTTLGAKGIERSIGTGKIVATLNGTVNPEGKPGKYHFEYRVSGTSAFTSTPTASAGEGSVPVEVHATIEAGPETSYEFRLVGENEAGASVFGRELQFHTPPAVSGVNSGSASGVTSSSATLTGSVKPQKLATKYHFEYGETLDYGKATPGAESSSGPEVAAEAALTGLRAGATYHFRLVATNEFGTTFGFDQTFATTGAPTIANIVSEQAGHTGETVKAKVQPHGLVPAKFHIEYGETEAYGTSTPETEVPVGEQIEAHLEGLKLATGYHFRIVATNSAGTTLGLDQTFTTTLIEGESAVLTSTGADLDALINPLGTNVSYHFEFGETTAYGTTLPEPDGTVAGKNGKAEEVKVDQKVAQALSGLKANTTYHYRVVATIEGVAEKGIGPDHTFTTPATSSAFKLPDGRAYEMVTPPNKHGGYVVPTTIGGGLIQAAEDGESLAYVTVGPILEGVEANRSPEPETMIATRGAGGWATQDIVTPTERPGEIRGETVEYEAFSPNLSLSLLQPVPFSFTPLAEPPLTPPLSEAERGHQEKTIYLRADSPIPPEPAGTEIYSQAEANGKLLGKAGYLALVSAANTPPGTRFGGVELFRGTVKPRLAFLAATPDLTHVVMRADGISLTSEAPSAPGLYEWSAGKLRLVSVLPSGQAAPAVHTDIASEEFSEGTGNQRLTNLRHALSSDGSRVFWTVFPPNKNQLAVGRLYMRDTTRGETVQIDAPENGIAQEGLPEATFQYASADGSKVFFTDQHRLTANSTARVGAPDLYVCEIGEVGGKLACQLTDLTANPNTGEAGGVQGIVSGASEDGTYVYLVAKGAFAPGAEAGADNLYVLHDTGTEWTRKFIATLSSEDSPDWGHPNKGNPAGTLSLSARVAPHGHYLAFMSNRRLTGYDNTDVNGEVADEEVFLYSANTETVSCVSCNPTGARPRGVLDTQLTGEGEGLLVDQSQIWRGEEVDHWLAGSIAGWTTISTKDGPYPSRNLSDSGRLFFNSADAIVPEATATRREIIVPGSEPVRAGVANVYEFEPNGVGSCHSEHGCIALLSSGTSEQESAFLDASANGGNVFILTAAKLLAQDTDTSYDIYDARECTEASPCLSEPPSSKPPCESTNSCRGEAPVPPGFGTPASSTFTGPAPKPHVIENSEVLHVKEKGLSSAQKLAKALASCRKQPHKTKAQKKKRSGCEAQARKKYGPKKAKKATHAKPRGK